MQKTLLLLLCTFLLATGLKAQHYDNTVAHLKSSDVEHYLKNFEQIKADFESANINYNEVSADFESVYEALKGSENAEQIVKKYGYSDLYNFWEKAWAITVAYVNIKFKTEGNPAFDKAIKEIDNNPGMTAEEKQLAKAQVEQIVNAVKANFEQLANAEDIRVVEPFIAQIDLLYKVEN